MADSKPNLIEMLTGTLHSLENTGLPSESDFKAQAFDKVTDFFKKLNPGFTGFNPDEKTFIDNLAREALAAFKSTTDPSAQPDPLLKSQESFLLLMLQGLARPASGAVPSPAQFEADAVKNVLAFFQTQLKNSSTAVKAFTPADESYVRDLAKKALNAAPGTAPDSAPAAAVSAFSDDKTRKLLVATLRQLDANARLTDLNNGVDKTDQQREDDLKQIIKGPRGAFLTALKKLTNAKSLDDLSPADLSELNDKMIPEAVTGDVPQPPTPVATPDQPATNPDQPSSGSHLEEQLVEIGDDVGAAFGVPYAGELGELAFDGVVLLGRSRLFRNCRALNGGQATSRGAILRGGSSRYILVPAN